MSRSANRPVTLTRAIRSNLREHGASASAIGEIEEVVDRDLDRDVPVERILDHVSVMCADRGIPAVSLGSYSEQRQLIAA